MKWNLIWQVDRDNLSSCIERDWLGELLSLMTIDSTYVDYSKIPFRKKPHLKLALPYSIICVSCPNQTNEADLIKYLENIPRPRVLYHMSDEYVKVGNEVYQHCDVVIRNGSARFDMLGDPKLIQIPLGYINGFFNASREIRPSSSRQYTYTFMGKMKDGRTEMLSELKKMPGQSYIRETMSFLDAIKYFNDSTISVYKESIFVPSPKGNWNPECNRLYDALEWGCVPLIKEYGDSEYHLNYHGKLLGNHPIPTFNHWSEAVNFSVNLLKDKRSLDSLQTRIFNWWQEYKVGLQIKIAEKLNSLSR